MKLLLSFFFLLILSILNLEARAFLESSGGDMTPAPAGEFRYTDF